MMDGSWGWWGPGVIVMVLCMVMMMRMMGGHGHGSHGSEGGSATGTSSPGPDRILADRLARGEIDIEEYERRLAALHERGDAHST